MSANRFARPADVRGVGPATPPAVDKLPPGATRRRLRYWHGSRRAARRAARAASAMR